MRKLWWVVLFWTSLGFGQVVQSGYVTYVTSAPSGSCSQNARVQVVMGPGTIYTCQSNVWTSGGSGGGGSPGGTNGQIQYNNNGAFGGLSQVPAVNGGLGLDSSSSTGCPSVTSGTWSIGTCSTYNATKNSISNLVCDGSTDDTTAFNSLLSGVNTAGGGTIVFPANQTCLFNSAEITLPNSGSPNYTMNPIRLTSNATSSGSYYVTTSYTQGGAKLNFTFNATDAKLTTLGIGTLEIDHLILEDTGSDCAPFLLTTNTVTNIHDNTFQGTASGTSACNDAEVFGGTIEATCTTSAASCGFQGYNSALAHNFFSKVKRGAVLRAYANSIFITNNTFAYDNGFSTGGAIEIIGTGTHSGTGNYVAGNLIETVNYLYGINLSGAAHNNSIIGNNCWDGPLGGGACVKFSSTATYNYYQAGTGQSSNSVGTSSSYSDAAGSATTNTELDIFSGSQSFAPQGETFSGGIAFNGNAAIPTPTISLSDSGTGGTLLASTTYCYDVVAWNQTGYSGTPTTGNCITTGSGANTHSITVTAANASSSALVGGYSFFGRNDGTLACNGSTTLCGFLISKNAYNNGFVGHYNAWTDTGALTPSTTPLININTSNAVGYGPVSGTPAGNLGNGGFNQYWDKYTSTSIGSIPANSRIFLGNAGGSTTYWFQDGTGHFSFSTESNNGMAIPAVSPTATQTTVNCSTSGSVVFSEPFQGSSLKDIEIFSNACLGTASYTYPVAFTNTPQVISQSLAAIATSVSTTAVTITGSTSTGFLKLDGY